MPQSLSPRDAHFLRLVPNYTEPYQQSYRTERTIARRWRLTAFIMSALCAVAGFTLGCLLCSGHAWWD